MRLPELDSLTAVEVAALLGVTDRAIRKWVTTKKLPTNAGDGVKTFKWSEVLAWNDRRVREDAGTDRTIGKNQPLPDASEVAEPYEDALARKTRAEADLKELQLARERGEVAAIADVEKILAASVMATQTQILAVPSRLSTQMLGIEDQARAVAILSAEMRQLLSNLATIDAIREASGGKAEADDE